MTQNGVVTKLLDRGRAEVAVERGTACGGKCDGCETCIYASRLVVNAENGVFAEPGDRVVLESETKSIMGAALLIYMLPVALLFAGYGAGAALGLAQGWRVLMSIAGAALGGAFAALIGRGRKEIVFRITGFCR